MSEPLLQVNHLQTSFFTHVGEVQAVRDVSFHVDPGEVLGIVGESGSGKSVTLMSIMRLIQKPGEIKGGQILFEGKDLLKLTEKQMSGIRGHHISMVFQDPMSSLNPIYRIGNQIVETILTHEKISHSEAKKRAVALLDLVRIPSAKTRVNCYPHEFSGGMRQRAMIAMALACHPKLLIADEPTTALDVTIQAQIMELFRDIRREEGSTIILVTHDLGVVSEICDRVQVMYGGKLMEQADCRGIFDHPQHPYTQGLLRSIPCMQDGVRERLKPIDGTPPDLLNPPKGCPFACRCEHTMQLCMEENAPLLDVGEGHSSACHLCNPRVKKLLEEIEHADQ